MVAGIGTAADNSFHEISAHYEAIRQSLMNDSTEGVTEHAAAIRDTALKLEATFSAGAAGVDADGAAAVQALLPEIIERSGRLAEAKGLKSVRAEFAELTKPLTRYHALVLGERPLVAYCPMEKKAWLQPDEQIGNPYDPSMLRCGDVVAR
jgi:hypothetical protein